MSWMKYSKIYFLISGAIIALGLFGLAKWGLNLGVDFKGGTIAEYSFEEVISTEDVKQKFDDSGIELFSIQEMGERKYLFRFPAIQKEDHDKISGVLQEVTSGSGIEELRFETVGPTIGPELIKKTIYAVILASLAILIWVAFQFKSFKFGISAVLAMFHDSIVLVGIFSILGHFWGAEVDFLFVTALLTTLSFSVHDTIVVYDRIREARNKIGGSTAELADKAITETMVRSLNNSFTIIFMLFALILLGGTTIKWFAVALFIGTVSGTYSSPFVAVPLIMVWEKISRKFVKKS